MDRISNIYQSDELKKTFNNKSIEIEKTRKQILSRKRIHAPHEAPYASKIFMVTQNQIKSHKQYQSNLKDASAYLEFYEGQLDHIIQIIQKLREQAVHGANGTLDKFDRILMAKEVNQYLDEILLTVNKTYRGQYVFSGHQIEKASFKVLHTEKKEGIEQALIQKLQYQGDFGKQYREVDKGNFMVINFPGTEIFWPTKIRLMSQVPATDYLAMSTHPYLKYQEIKINNVRVRIQDGDHLHKIVDRINQSNAPVEAYVDNTNGNHFIVLKSQTSSYLHLEDLNGSTVLKDLGLLEKSISGTEEKISSRALIEGNSLFEDLISLRNAFLDNNVDLVQSGIGKLDMALDHIAYKRSEIGFKQNRLEKLEKVLQHNLQQLEKTLNNVDGIPLEKKIAELKEQEVNYQISLNLGSKVNRLNLFDFIK